MTQLELGACSTVYEHFLKEDRRRRWTELDNHLYSLAQLDDDQLAKEVEQQLWIHEKKRPTCVMDHNHAAGKCLAVTTLAAARAIHKDFEAGSVFTDGERYILEHYLALAHIEKTK